MSSSIIGYETALSFNTSYGKECFCGMTKGVIKPSPQVPEEVYKHKFLRHQGQFLPATPPLQKRKICNDLTNQISVFCIDYNQC